jgi:hypothetical protein
MSPEAPAFVPLNGGDNSSGTSSPTTPTHACAVIPMENVTISPYVDRTFRCHYCGGWGHYRRGCPSMPAENEMGTSDGSSRTPQM